MTRKQVTCECDPLLPRNQRCSGGWFRCKAGVAAMLMRLRATKKCTACKQLIGEKSFTLAKGGFIHVDCQPVRKAKVRK